MRGNTLRLIEPGRPLCAEIFSWNGYPCVKKNYRFDTQSRVWRRSWKTKIRNSQRPKEYSESCFGFQMVLWTTIEIWLPNSCISLWEEIKFINWASLSSQTKSHLSLQQGRKMVKRWREVTDSTHRNISRSFQALSDWTWNDGGNGTHQQSICKNIGCGSADLRCKSGPFRGEENCSEYCVACLSAVYKVWLQKSPLNG